MPAAQLSPAADLGGCMWSHGPGCWNHCFQAVLAQNSPGSRRFQHLMVQIPHAPWLLGSTLQSAAYAIHPDQAGAGDVMRIGG